MLLNSYFFEGRRFRPTISISDEQYQVRTANSRPASDIGFRPAQLRDADLLKSLVDLWLLTDSGR